MPPLAACLGVVRARSSAWLNAAPTCSGWVVLQDVKHRPISRPKDLIDTLLISELAPFDAGSLRATVDALFAERATHAVSDTLSSTPADWARPYAAMAAEVGLDIDPSRGRADAEVFLAPVLGGRVAAGLGSAAAHVAMSGSDSEGHQAD